METFLERNDLEGDYVAMSVSGQSGLSRFFRPPPVDVKTLPDIVKYEVKQQIPFPIEDVIWDWQCLGGTDVDDVVVDAEVGLFAIKRDTVFQALQPFTDSNIEVDLVQLSPLAVYNVICHDVLDEIPDMADIDPDNPPESLVVLSMGTDATDLIITNGVKLWLRNIPIGGNHFTKQLSRELKLTHAKAEHLKRNVRQMAENEEEARRVFQSMRPVFGDLVTEIQRSLTFYGGIEKNANIERVVLLGNAARLPGLRQYLNKQLELNIVKVSKFDNLTGDVIGEKSFSDNMLSFTPCYGLCLQGLKNASIGTNLLPNEFVKERLIRAKKPWVLATVAALMAGLAFSFLFSALSWWKVDEDYTADGRSWKDAKAAVESRVSVSKNYESVDIRQKKHLERLNDIARELSDSSESRTAWPELLSVIFQITPSDPRITDGRANPNEIPFDERNEIYIRDLETQFFPDLSTWRAFTADRYEWQFANFPSVEEAQEAAEKQGKSEETVDEHDLNSPGWVIQFGAYHFHNNDEQRLNSQHMMEFVRQTLLKKMEKETVELPGSERREDGTYKNEEFMLADVGIYYPTVVNENSLIDVEVVNYAARQAGIMADNSSADDDDGDEGSDERGNDDEAAEGVSAKDNKMPDVFELKRYDFIVQFAWIPTSREQRLINRELRIQRETKDKEAEQKKNKDRQKN